MTLNSILQAVTTLPQALSGPTVGTIISAFAGVTALFILKEIIGMRDKVRSIWTAMYGEEDTKVESGLLYEAATAKVAVTALNATFTDHVNKEQTWQRDLTLNISSHANRTQGTLSDIELRLKDVEAHAVTNRDNIAVNTKTLQSLSHGRRKP